MISTRTLSLALFALVLSSCDTATPSATADSRFDTAASRTQSTVVPYGPEGVDMEYAFSDSKAEWDGTFSVTSLDEKGNPIITFRQSATAATGGGIESYRNGGRRYGIDFSWSPSLGDQATIEYLSIDDDGTVHTLAAVDNFGEGGTSDGPGRSYHVYPNGAVRIDYPLPGDPFHATTPVVTERGEAVYGVTDVQLRFPESVEVPTAVAARFTYPWGVTFSYEIIKRK